MTAEEFTETLQRHKHAMEQALAQANFQNGYIAALNDLRESIVTSDADGADSQG
jgi:hypothetical protein